MVNQIPSVPAPQNPGKRHAFGISGEGAHNSFPEREGLPFKYGDSKPVKNTPQQAFYTTPPVNGYVTEQPSSDIRSSMSSKVDSASVWKVVGGIIAGLLALFLVVVLAWAISMFGTAGAIASTILAFFPFILIFVVFRWLGKWDPEPLPLRIGAFIYGAAGSILLTFGISGLYGLIFGEPTTMFGAAAIQAPLVEEFAKGIGLLALALFFRRYFDGPVDGMVYMALIAGGFAFTENILYFGNSYMASGPLGLTMTFIMRGMMSPFAHIIFSLPMGIAAGVMLAKRKKWWQVLLAWASMYPLAAFLHGLWNGTSVIVQDQNAWFMFYLLIEVPIFIAFILLAIHFRRTEAMNTLRRVTEYGHQGWFTRPEVDAYATWEGRKRMMLWAKRSHKNPQAPKILKSLFHDVVHLSYIRTAIVTPSKLDKEALQQEELETLNRISANKYVLSQG